MITQIRRIDYVVLNAGVLNYPNVSEFHKSYYQVLTVLESHRSVIVLISHLSVIC